MSKRIERTDDFAFRREHLQALSDAELKTYFWQLANQTIEPLVALAKHHTSPSIERSVLMRMGFSSIESKQIVDRLLPLQLLKKGAGGVVYRKHLLTNLPIREAGLALLEEHGVDDVILFYGGSHEAK